MIKQLLIERVDFWLDKRKECKNKLTEQCIELVLDELLLIAKELYNSHLITITTYLTIENKIKYKNYGRKKKNNNKSS